MGCFFDDEELRGLGGIERAFEASPIDASGSIRFAIECESGNSNDAIYKVS